MPFKVDNLTVRRVHNVLLVLLLHRDISRHAVVPVEGLAVRTLVLLFLAILNDTMEQEFHLGRMLDFATLFE